MGSDVFLPFPKILLIMKRLSILLSTLFALSVANAQVENSIVIEQNSFRPVQTDALTGVNIDPIGLDFSMRPCARLKVKINRMTKEEIDGIEVKVITNNAVMKCKTAEYDNGLIIELTAKPQTRFYFHHDEFGDSNEVILNLDADKEYRLDAHLNQQYPITIIADVEGADVYIDDIFKGRTTSNNRLVVHDIIPGKHGLKVEYSGKICQEEIDVSKENLVFMLRMLDKQSEKPKLLSQKVTLETKYSVGDYYNQDGKEGVVFEVTEDGLHGKIISMTQSSKLQWASDKKERDRFIDANNKTDGTKNMETIQQIPGWEKKYPAFKWCADLGDGWYLPAIEELKLLLLNRDTHAVVNKTLSEKGGVKLFRKGDSGQYWSSTQEQTSQFDEACAWSVDMEYNFAYYKVKRNHYFVRAIATF